MGGASGADLGRACAQRLGHGAMGLKRLKGHPFFAGTDWVAVATGTAVVPEELKRRLGELSGAVETTFQV